MTKLITNHIASRYGSIDGLNDNFDRIETALENTLSRDGTAPNAMEAALDMNGNAILNAGAVYTSNLVLNGNSIVAGNAFNIAGFAVFPFTATAGQTSFSVSPATLAPSSYVKVYVNGIKLKATEVSFLGSTVTTPAMELGDEVEVEELKVGA